MIGVSLKKPWLVFPKPQPLKCAMPLKCAIHVDLSPVFIGYSELRGDEHSTTAAHSTLAHPPPGLGVPQIHRAREISGLNGKIYISDEYFVDHKIMCLFLWQDYVDPSCFEHSLNGVVIDLVGPHPKSSKCVGQSVNRWTLSNSRIHGVWTDRFGDFLYAHASSKWVCPGKYVPPKSSE